MAPALVVLGLIFGGYLKGYSDADRSAEIALLNKAFTEVKLERDIEKAARVADAAKASAQAKRMLDLTTRTDELQEYANALEDAGRECLAGADTDQLRNLWR